MGDRKKWPRFLALMLACVMLLPAAGYFTPVPAKAAASDDLKEELDELKREQDELEKQKQELQGQIHDNMGEMEKLVAQKNVIDQEIFLLNQEVANINLQIQTYNLLIAQKQQELDDATERFEKLTEENKDRIRTMEMYGELSYWSVLAQASSFGELLDRTSMVKEIADADNRRLKELDKAAEAVEEAQRLLTGEKAELEAVRAELDVAQAEMMVKRQEADNLLAQLIAKGEEYSLWLEQMEQEQTQLLDKIAQTEKEYNAAKAEEDAASRPDPGAKPPSSVTDGVTWLIPINYWYFSSAYGMRDHPIDGVPKFHHGVDLAAPEGTPIFASRSGVVTAASYGTANGYYVTINHGDGFSTMYLHMTHYTVSVGQWVEAGQKIGECGNTGASKGNHLHFGIYYNGSSVNPAEYIDFY